MIEVFVGLGSNLGDRAAHIESALASLRSLPKTTLTQTATVIETEPLGPPQPKYLNTVSRLETHLAARELLTCCQRIEAEHRRTRTEHWGPRTLDLDILLYGEACSEEDDLVLPHPELHNREFVLVPLVEIAPNRRHPKFKKTMGQLLAALRGSEPPCASSQR